MVLKGDINFDFAKGMRAPKVKKKTLPHKLILILKISTPSSLLHPSSEHQPKYVITERVSPTNINE